jgi:hypothetical protein
MFTLFLLWITFWLGCTSKLTLACIFFENWFDFPKIRQNSMFRPSNISWKANKTWKINSLGEIKIQHIYLKLRHFVRFDHLAEIPGRLFIRKSSPISHTFMAINKSTQYVHPFPNQKKMYVCIHIQYIHIILIYIYTYTHIFHIYIYIYTYIYR